MKISSLSASILNSKAMLLSALAKASQTFIDVSEEELLAFVMKETRGCISPAEVISEIKAWWI